MITRTTNLGIFILSQFLIFALELGSNLISLFLATIFNGRLNDTASIVLEDYVSHPTTDDIHKVLDVFLAFGRWDIFLSDKRPNLFGVDEQCRVRFGSTTLFLQNFLCLMRLAGG